MTAAPVKRGKKAVEGAHHRVKHPDPLSRSTLSCCCHGHPHAVKHSSLTGSFFGKKFNGDNPQNCIREDPPPSTARVHEEDRTAAAVMGSHAGSARLTGISVSTATVTPRDHIANREIILGSLMQKDKDQFVKPCFKSCFSNLQIYEIH